MVDVPLGGLRVGVTASRKVAEQAALLERSGAEVVWAPMLAIGAGRLADADLRADVAPLTIYRASDAPLRRLAAFRSRLVAMVAMVQELEPVLVERPTEVGR